MTELLRPFHGLWWFRTRTGGFLRFLIGTILYVPIILGRIFFDRLDDPPPEEIWVASAWVAFGIVSSASVLFLHLDQTKHAIGAGVLAGIIYLAVGLTGQIVWKRVTGYLLV